MSTNHQEHIVSSYDEDLRHLVELVSQMGGRCEALLVAAMQALAERDRELANRTIADDAPVDALERAIDDAATKLLVLRQPVAVDLRQVVGALKVSHLLERIGDYSVNIAKRSLVLSEIPPLQATRSVCRMGPLARRMLKGALDAFVERDAEEALNVWRADQELDELYNSLFREILTHMVEEPRQITACAHLMFVAKNVERIGDHATNVAEIVYYMVEGTPLTEQRPKGTQSLYSVSPSGESNGEADGP